MTITSRGALAPGRDADDRFDSASLDAAVLSVASNVDRWSSTGPAAREALLGRVQVDLAAASGGWLEAACRAKGLVPGSFEASEELFSGIGVLARYVQELRVSLRQIEAKGRPSIPGRARHVPGGRVAVGVVPRDGYDRLLLARQHGEVWMQPGLSPEEVVAGQAHAYREPEAHRGVALVLAAGNVASLGPNDVLSKLFVSGKVVVLKSNPVNDYLVEHWERAFKALIDEGVLRIVRGGTAAGAHLVAHSLIDEIHVTGSDKTYDAIVFGPGEEGARRKGAGVRLVTKPVTAELAASHPWSSCRVAGRPRSVVPSGARGLDARQQRGLQLPHATGGHHVAALAAARGVPPRDRVHPRVHTDARGLLPGCTRATRALRRSAPGRARRREGRRRSPSVDVSTRRPRRRRTCVAMIPQVEHARKAPPPYSFLRSRAPRGVDDPVTIECRMRPLRD